MAAIASTSRLTVIRPGTLLLRTGAALTACLSVAAALGGLRKEGATPLPPSAAAEAAARDERIAFFEQRAAADPLDSTPTAEVR
jgi:hypothetical protein